MNAIELPEPDDAEAIFRFAMTFNGYEYYGSFEACEHAARSGDRSTIALVRNELFFEARASRHRGDGGFVGLYAELLPRLRELLG